MYLEDDQLTRFPFGSVFVVQLFHPLHQLGMNGLHVLFGRVIGLDDADWPIERER